jgi:uncharacterized protein YjbJ (UPF0337 family)
MNWDQIEGNWKQAKGKVKEQCGKLTDDDIAMINGKRDQLAGKVQERYGIAKDEAERQVSDWERSARDHWFLDAAGACSRQTPESRDDALSGVVHTQLATFSSRFAPSGSPGGASLFPGREEVWSWFTECCRAATRPRRDRPDPRRRSPSEIVCGGRCAWQG